MRYTKRYIIITGILAVLLSCKFRLTGTGFAQVEHVQGADIQEEDWNPLIAASTNQRKLTVIVNGKEYTNLSDGIYMDEDLRIMLPLALVGDSFDCSAHVYDEKTLQLQKREDIWQFPLNEDRYLANGEEKKAKSVFITKDGEQYVALEQLAGIFGYSYEWDGVKHVASVQDTTGGGSCLPYRYDMREQGRAPEVKNQGDYSTCWAFAALTALESSLRPEEKLELSVDHMNKNNSYQTENMDGGQYTMAMAYLSAWQGPVFEADDPYGDGETDSTLEAVRHVQEMQIIEAKDFEHIKEAVFKYGGVESCIYTSMQTSEGESYCYNREKAAYCYMGEDRPNHDVVIIGWDDSYPKENFPVNVEGDGAFICQNSWGSDFGEDGVFYVSYYDTNIGIHNLVYTGIEAADNYDDIYQSDLCGWVGQMGYNKESVYGANVYTAHADQQLEAAGFYTTGKNTSYQVYLVPEFTDRKSLDDRILMAEGRFTNAGFHTVRFQTGVDVKKDQRFAVVLWLSTPNAVRPMAIEYVADEVAKNVDLSDGEGYISARGEKWVSAESASNCNLCIKAYASGRSE